MEGVNDFVFESIMIVEINESNSVRTKALYDQLALKEGDEVILTIDENVDNAEITVKKTSLVFRKITLFTSTCINLS
ncbi:MAG TPA: hypothetical protein VMZ29_08725 [Candidatus Bathyarchaeia archaeon]|nr:hypothetical protein [Candidatus Bathyarchaeia archaeon]